MNEANRAGNAAPDGLDSERVQADKVDDGRSKTSFIQKVWRWLRKGKVEPTTKVPLQRKGEKFKGFKITWKW